MQLPLLRWKKLVMSIEASLFRERAEDEWSVGEPAEQDFHQKSSLIILTYKNHYKSAKLIGLKYIIVTMNPYSNLLTTIINLTITPGSRRSQKTPELQNN